jgi:hypothetical protein
MLEPAITGITRPLKTAHKQSSAPSGGSAYVATHLFAAINLIGYEYDNHRNYYMANRPDDLTPFVTQPEEE